MLRHPQTARGRSAHFYTAREKVRWHHHLKSEIEEAPRRPYPKKNQTEQDSRRKSDQERRVSVCKNE
jgi:hypothetical protein